jgi:hypothetical protein
VRSLAANAGGKGSAEEQLIVMRKRKFVTGAALQLGERMQHKLSMTIINALGRPVVPVV